MEPIRSSDLAIRNAQLVNIIRELQEASQGVSEELLGVKNATYTSNQRKDRVSPPTSEEKSTVVEPKDATRIIDGSPQLSRVREGTIVINNTPISVDPSVDTFQDIVIRINTSSAKVSAHYDQTNERLVLTSDTGGKIEVISDSSNFLEEVNILPGTYQASTMAPARTIPGSTQNAAELFDRLAHFVDTYNSFVSNEDIAETTKKTVTESTRRFIAHATNMAPQNTGFSILGGSMHFEFSTESPQPIQFNLGRSYNVQKASPGTFEGFFDGEQGFGNKLSLNIDIYKNTTSETDTNLAKENIAQDSLSEVKKEMKNIAQFKNEEDKQIDVVI